MELAKQLAIETCGRCGQSERAHQHSAGTDPADVQLFAALGGSCPQFVVSDGALIYQRHLAITNHREPRHRPGHVGKRPSLCPRCLNRGHTKDQCPL